jgi:hypothetical protein
MLIFFTVLCFQVVWLDMAKEQPAKSVTRAHGQQSKLRKTLLAPLAAKASPPRVATRRPLLPPAHVSVQHVLMTGASQVEIQVVLLFLV